METHYHEDVDYRYSIWARGILGGVFTGLITTVLNLAFDVVYRQITGYDYATFVNINTITAFSVMTVLAAGILYFILKKYVKAGAFIYLLTIVVFTVLMLFIDSFRPALSPFSAGLAMGIIIITGAMAAFVLPYIAEHPKLWG